MYKYSTVKRLYTDPQYNDKICYNDNLTEKKTQKKPLTKEVTFSQKFCEDIYLIPQETYVLGIC